MRLEAPIWGLQSWYQQKQQAHFLAVSCVRKDLNDQYNVLLWPDLHMVDKPIPVFPPSALQEANFAFPRTKHLLWWKVCARLLEDLEASWEAVKDSEQFVPTKISPAQGLLDLTAWHHLSPNSWHNWKFLGWHIFIGSVWYSKMYKSYGSTLGFSKISLSANNKVKPVVTDPWMRLDMFLGRKLKAC